MIQIQCACGATIETIEAYAGGQVACTACGAIVLVPADLAALEEKFRFHCPHCHTRVVARKSSAGKKSQCPSCQQIYIVPDPPAEPTVPPPDPRRVSIDDDRFAMFTQFPFPVGKLDRGMPAPPRPRYLHSPSSGEQISDDDFHPLPASDTGVQRPPEAAPPQRPAFPPIAPAVSPAPENRNEPGRADREAAPRLPPHHFDIGDRSIVGPEPFPPADFTPAAGVPTAAAIPQFPFAAKPASVGELQVVGGECTGERVRIDFHRFLIGRERDCDLRPGSMLVSRHHCVFKKDEYALRVRDLGSKGGTFVNGRRIHNEVVLSPGDQVKVGDVTLYVALPQPPQVLTSTADSNPSLSDFVIL